MAYRSTRKPISTDADTKSTTPFLLAGDIGGTTTRLAFYRGPGPNDDENDPKFKTALASKDYFNYDYIKTYGGSKAFGVIMDEFLKMSGVPASGEIVACFACAGPIINNACEFTNAGNDGDRFVIRGNDIASSSAGVQARITVCKVVNDFVGQGYGCLDVNHDTEVIELVPGSLAKIDSVGPKICVGAGTGLGECYLTASTLDSSQGYECYPSEGGHVEFSPRSELEVKLWTHLKNRYGKADRISVERIVSGKGIANVYEFLASEFPEKVDKEMHEKFLVAADMQGKVVGENIKPGNLSDLAMKIFSSTYGSEVGCCAIKWIPTGGIYVTGGIIGKNLKTHPEYYLGKDSPFMKAYFDKGRVSPILDDIPVFALKGADMGLRGARVCALKVMKNYMRNKE